MLLISPNYHGTRIQTLNYCSVLHISEEYSEICETTKMESFPKIIPSYMLHRVLDKLTYLILHNVPVDPLRKLSMHVIFKWM